MGGTNEVDTKQVFFKPKIIIFAKSLGENKKILAEPDTGINVINLCLQKKKPDVS